MTSGACALSSPEHLVMSSRVPRPRWGTNPSYTATPWAWAEEGVAPGGHHYHNVVHFRGLALQIREPIPIAPLPPPPSFPIIVECSPPRPPAPAQPLLSLPWYGQNSNGGYGRDSADPYPAPPPTPASEVPSPPVSPSRAEPHPARGAGRFQARQRMPGGPGHRRVCPSGRHGHAPQSPEGEPSGVLQLAPQTREGPQAAQEEEPPRRPRPRTPCQGCRVLMRQLPCGDGLYCCSRRP